MGMTWKCHLVPTKALSLKIFFFVFFLVPESATSWIWETRSCNNIVTSGCLYFRTSDLDPYRHLLIFNRRNRVFSEAVHAVKMQQKFPPETKTLEKLLKKAGSGMAVENYWFFHQLFFFIKTKKTLGYENWDLNTVNFNL